MQKLTMIISWRRNVKFYGSRLSSEDISWYKIPNGSHKEVKFLQKL